MHTPTIRTEINEYLQVHNMKTSDFATATGLNPGTVSSILTSNRALSVHQLDCVTTGMGKPEDYFYTRYVQDYIVDTSLDWRRVKSFLNRCAVLNRLDCIAQVVVLLMDNFTYYAGLVFDLAEDFFEQKQYEAAALLYRNVAFSEKNQHSERLATCHYRLFQMRIGDDQIQNLKAAIEFEPYAERLEEIEQLDALKDLANLYRAIGQWNKVFELAQDMGRKAKIQYRLKHQSGRKNNDAFNKLSKPLFTYIAYSDHLSASACDERGDYEQGARHIQAYGDLSWVKEEDPEALHWIQTYREWAEINACVNKLMSGDMSVLHQYVDYIDNKQDNIFVELINVLEIAILHNVDIDSIIERFEHRVMDSWDQGSDDVYTRNVLPDEMARFWYKTAKYRFGRGSYLYGFKSLILCLELSVTINNRSLILSAMGLFEYYRDYSTPETQKQFNKIIKEVWVKHDEKDGFFYSFN